LVLAFIFINSISLKQKNFLYRLTHHPEKGMSPFFRFLKKK